MRLCNNFWWSRMRNNFWITLIKLWTSRFAFFFNYYYNLHNCPSSPSLLAHIVQSSKRKKFWLSRLKVGMILPAWYSLPSLYHKSAPFTKTSSTVSTAALNLALLKVEEFYLRDHLMSADRHKLPFIDFSDRLNKCVVNLLAQKKIRVLPIIVRFNSRILYRWPPHLKSKVNINI